MRLTEIVKGINAYGLENVVFCGADASQTEITGLCADSRLCKSGDLFFCINGKDHDGHRYVKNAVRRGACAIVAEREIKDIEGVAQIIVKDTRAAMSVISLVFYGEPSKEMKIIGVTGTNGKTTVSHMLVSVLRASGVETGLIGTLGISYGRKKIAPELTTPDPIYLAEILSDMKRSGVEYVVMEVSAHALRLKKLYGIKFSACIFTNLSQDHLDFFKDMNDYRQAKLGLFDEACPLAIVNGDDDTGLKIAKSRAEKGLETIVYGLDAPADAFAVITHESLYGSEFMLNVSDSLCRITLSMTGRHNVYNALAAATCAYAFGVGMSDVRAGFKDLNGVNGRLQFVENFRGGDVFVDFAHTPDGLEKSLASLKAHCKGKLYCLFGCGGNRDKGKRSVMGETAAKKADFCVLTSDNPRYEEPLDIISEIERGYRRFSSRYVVVPDRKKAIDYALDLLTRGDVLLVAGKGGEDYQEIMGIKYYFNDNDIIKKLMEQKREDPFA